MSFQTELLDAIGVSTDAHDIRAATRRCWFYDIMGYPTRLWDGQGVLITTGNVEWLGTIDGNGVSHHQAPAIRDSRDGASPRYEFKLPFLDATTFDALKADRALVEGRELTCYNVICKVGEGLRPGTALRFSYKLLMQGADFSEGVDMDGGALRRTYSATILARSLEYGRSKAPFGTYTATAQVERARLLGYGADTFCNFVAGNHRRTYVVGE